MPSDSVLTPAHRRAIASILDRVRRAKPRVRMLEVLGRPDDELAMRVDQLEKACVGALELDELAMRGEM